MVNISYTGRDGKPVTYEMLEEEYGMVLAFEKYMGLPPRPLPFELGVTVYIENAITRGDLFFEVWD